MHTPAHVLGKAVNAAEPLNKKSFNFSGQKTNAPASPSNTGPAHTLERYAAGKEVNCEID